MTYFLTPLHFISQFFLGGCFLLSIASYFQTSGWSAAIRESQHLFNKLLWVWGVAIVILLLSPKFYLIEELTAHKKIYFNPIFLIGRNVGYFALSWLCLHKLPRLSPLAIMSFLLVGNFFAFDWGLSLEGEWLSNMYGLIYLCNGVLAAMAFFMFTSFAKAEEKSKIDLVHLLLTISIFWFYLHFSQFIIIWMGNLPREATFYLERLEQFGTISIIMTLILKVLPIALVSFRTKWKVKPAYIKPICAIIVMSCLFECFWLVRYP